ncbi:glycosyltransferase [uncultured Chryseobacterium sp.]|uniref:glycosyltransferase n=1 Tax=uncultured Chryseobacterium sp. TaxID=259322 RepID=UPI002628E4D2|nr:glycosyltransferase [uncultured Chryseobacterium sp.]
MKVLVSVFGNLATDQRVEKVCRTLHENAYEISLIGNNWKRLPEMVRPYPFKRLELSSKFLKAGYPEFNFKLYQELLKQADKSTILLANDLDSLLPNYLVSKKLGIPLVFDSHEIFTEMPSVQGRFTQKIWRFLERKLVPKLKYMMSASESYSKWFAETYHIQKPITVQNFPRKVFFEKKFTENKPKIIFYQGAVNPSRGLDKMIPVMKNIENAVFWIAGDGPKKEEYIALTKNLGLEEKVKFLGNIESEKLREITTKADVGLSIEENNGLSYYYSLPNKVSDYIQAGVPVLTTNYPETSKIINQYKVGAIINNHSEDELVSKVSEILNNGKEFYAENLRKAASELCWENEEQKIISLFDRVVQENFR